MKLSKSLKKPQKEIYIEVCSLVWGCVPVDVEWAMETKIYQEAEKKYLKKKQNESSHV